MKSVIFLRNYLALTRYQTDCQVKGVNILVTLASFIKKKYIYIFTKAVKWPFFALLFENVNKSTNCFFANNNIKIYGYGIHFLFEIVFDILLFGNP
jgi:hypothetical protein